MKQPEARASGCFVSVKRLRVSRKR